MYFVSFSLNTKLIIPKHSPPVHHCLSQLNIEFCIKNNLNWFKKASIALRLTENELCDYGVALKKYTEKVHIFL